MDDVFIGRIEVRPPLNDTERAHLATLGASGSTLRGTPTGRGDTSVPFAHLAWEACPSGCCLTWNGLEHGKHLAESLRFLVQHLFGPEARVAGHPAFSAFTCDHVLDGLVAARGRDGRTYVVEASRNRVSGRDGRPACAQGGDQRRGRARPRPANVIEFRPRRA
ncbi:hypothetical protein [Nocardioides currus]|uniref:Uncharacterized protein n=1 Tax=Nocardioides currus TaxID=2133958 RepID=A0A2R7Z2F8_9ACTN|nr:hypothetical protein [Nocardioides currus]PUA82426.1 hypothetical protein C7S10_01355 [Nocardioides currus]